tara:strand:+ start:180 stop:422 length:243 start_codon:yes stop_codon:yes gene_type:complete
MNNSTLNVQHNVTLTEGEISTILYYLEEVSSKWVGKHDEDSLRGNVDTIFSKLEGVVDSYYEELEEINELKAALNEGTKV